MLRKIDQAKDIISASGESPERKRAAIAALDKARAQEVLKADKLDRAVDLVLKRVHQQRGTGPGNGRFWVRSVSNRARRRHEELVQFVFSWLCVWVCAYEENSASPCGSSCGP